MEDLFSACEKDFSGLDGLLKQNPNIINVKDNHGYTPLARACIYGAINNVELLLKAGAKPTLEGCSYISTKNKLAIIRILLDAGADPNISRRNGKNDFIESLMFRVDDLKYELDHREIIEEIMTRNIGKGLEEENLKILHNTYEDGEIEYVQIARKYSKSNDPKLMYSALKHFVDRKEKILLLMEDDLDINHVDEDGNTFLMYYCGNVLFFQIYLDVIIKLLNAGIPMNHKNKKGETALIMYLDNWIRDTLENDSFKYITPGLLNKSYYNVLEIMDLMIDFDNQSDDDKKIITEKIQELDKYWDLKQYKDDCEFLDLFFVSECDDSE